MPLDRKQFLQLTGASIVALPRLAMTSEIQPSLSRIRCVTIGAPDVAATADLYTSALGYEVIAREPVSAEQALAWGAPAASGQPMVAMRPATGEDVLIRAVGIEPVDGYQPMSSWGWNAYEIIVNDLYEFHERMLKTGFRHIGGPQTLGGSFASIHASQYVGPANEVLYFNCETGDRSESILPDPGDDVGRANICILAAGDLEKTMAFYDRHFDLPDLGHFETTIGVVANAQGMSPDTIYTIGLMRLGQPGNAIEFDVYPDDFGPRARADGHLPPGNAMASFEVQSLDAVRAQFLGPVYESASGERSAALAGPAGELIELIEASA